MPFAASDGSDSSPSVPRAWIHSRFTPGERFERLHDDDDLDRAFRQVPANRFLGFRLLSRSENEAAVSMEVAAKHIQETGVVHGGILGALADTAAVYALLPDLPENRRMTSIEFKVNFLRPARAEGGRVVARSRVVQRGRNVGVCDVELTQDDVRVAKGMFTYLFFEPG